MKGQASAEYLLLFMVSLAMLGISLAALSRIRAGAEEGIESAAFGMDAASLAATVRETCALGGGNSREILLSSRNPMSIESEPEGPDTVFRISDASNRSRGAFYCPCPIEAESGITGIADVKNEDGKVIIRGR